MAYYTLRDGEKIHVHEVGCGDEPVVLLHGLGMDGSSWLPFAAPSLLNKKFYIPDFRGWGRSRNAKITDGYYYGQVADDVHNLIEKIGAPSVALVGISMGASIGLEYLKRHGDSRISRYMHIDHPTHLIHEDNPNIAPASLIETGEAMMELARFYDPQTDFVKLPKDYQRQHFKLLYGVLRNSLKFPWQKAIALSIEYNPIMRDFLSRHTPQGCWYATLKAVESAATGDFDVRQELPAIQCPITNVVGTHDTLFPLDELRHVSELAPNAELIEFDNSGHLLMLTETPKFMRVFKDFIDQGDGAHSYELANGPV